MKSKLDLAAAMLQAGFAPDLYVGGYRKRIRIQDPNSNFSRVEELWVSEIQARAALAAAENNISWTEDDIESLSETLARNLKEAGIKPSLTPPSSLPPVSEDPNKSLERRFENLTLYEVEAERPEVLKREIDL